MGIEFGITVLGMEIVRLRLRFEICGRLRLYQPRAVLSQRAGATTLVAEGGFSFIVIIWLGRT